jgi:proteic killer suppression protein
MIRSFSDGALKRLWEDGRTKGIDPISLPKIRRLLAALNAICHPDEMDVPGNRFHALKGDRRFQYAVTVRANWRLVFEWDGEHVIRVRQEDYHGD